MKDVEGLSFAKIARRLGERLPVIYKAYDHAHPEIVQKSIDERHAICREPKRARLRPEQVKKVKEMLCLGCPWREIVNRARCSLNTINRLRQRLNQDGVRLPTKSMRRNFRPDRRDI